MNKVSGRIILRESNEGIPNLLVTAYDTSSGIPLHSQGQPHISNAPNVQLTFPGIRRQFLWLTGNAYDLRVAGRSVRVAA